MNNKLIVVAAMAMFASGVKLSEMEQGAEFKQCISIADFEGKTLDDDISLIDRDADSGCCPQGSVPGAKYYKLYQGAQVVCGFTEDGRIATSESTSNGVKTCTYNKCYIMKQDLKCAEEGRRQTLNGCCTSTKQDEKMQLNFPATCKIYEKSFVVGSTKVAYCTTYDVSLRKVFTPASGDDQQDGKLVPGNLYSWTPCAGSLVLPTKSPPKAPTENDATYSPTKAPTPLYEGGANGTSTSVAILWVSLLAAWWIAK